MPHLHCLKHPRNPSKNKKNGFENRSFILFFVANTSAVAGEGVEFIAILALFSYALMYSHAIDPHKEVIS